jgi:poly(3-hydroxybutyrate) depolymerase
MSKGSARRKQQVSSEKFAEQWDAIFGIKKDPKTLEDHVWNDKMKEMQIGVDLAMIEKEKQ